MRYYILIVKMLSHLPAQHGSLSDPEIDSLFQLGYNWTFYQI